MTTTPFTLAACAEMLWPDKPMEWRLKRLTEMGFQCGIWNWTSHDLGMLERSGAVFSSMTGYIRGRLADDEGAEELLATAKQSIEVGKRLNVARLNLHGTGLGGRGLPVTPCETVTGAMWLKARDTLKRIADLAEQHGVKPAQIALAWMLHKPGITSPWPPREVSKRHSARSAQRPSKPRRASARRSRAVCQPVSSVKMATRLLGARPPSLMLHPSTARAATPCWALRRSGRRGARRRRSQPGA